DNHGSHLTGKFLRFAIDHKIIILCFPPHTTHLLQPLDVGLFSPLQTHYTKLVAAAVRFGGIRGVDKALFLEYYHKAQELAFTKDNIERAWANTGLHPLTSVPAKLNLTEEQLIEEAVAAQDAHDEREYMKSRALTSAKATRKAKALHKELHGVDYSLLPT
ncbi:DDE-domain-containing protein, partial [Amniculicola lignicola CBS 123094]